MKLPYALPAVALVATALFAPRPALAMPTCEQEVSIRCQGHDVQGRPRLDTRYGSYEECVRAEQPMRCGTEYDPYASLKLSPLEAITRQSPVLPA